MSKPVKCLVINGPNGVECPRPYKVLRRDNGLYVVTYADDQEITFEISVGMLAELLNDAYKRGVDDAVEIVVKKALDHVMGSC